MAVSKHNRASGCETNPFFLELFRDRSDSDDRERTWLTAMAHAGEGTVPLRFPIYETLYLINLYSQKLVDLLEDVATRFGIDQESFEYRQSLIQSVRAAACVGIASHLQNIELTEEWLFERLQARETNKFHDPEDIYISVRRREAERTSQGLPPRIQFLDQTPSGAESHPTSTC